MSEQQRRVLGHIGAFEFRASSQPALLRNISEWMRGVEKESALPGFLMNIVFDLREEDLDERYPYIALVYLDGFPSLPRKV